MALTPYRVDSRIKYDVALGAINGSLLTASRLLVNTTGLSDELGAVRGYIVQGRKNERDGSGNPLAWQAATLDPPEKLPDEVIGWSAFTILNENEGLPNVASRLNAPNQRSYQWYGNKIRRAIWGREVEPTSPGASYAWAAPATLFAHAAEAVSTHLHAHQDKALDAALQLECPSSNGSIEEIRFPSKVRHRFGSSYKAVAVAFALCVTWIEKQDLPGRMSEDEYVEWADKTLSALAPIEA